MILQRLKNLWKLSAYRLEDKNLISDIRQEPRLVKDFLTVKKKLATIIKDDSRTVLEREAEENDNSSK